MLIEWHLSNRPCEDRNIKQFRVLRAFTWCTGHRWCKTKDLFVFCSSVKSVWLCFMVFVLFYVICVRYHEVLKCRTSVTTPYQQSGFDLSFLFPTYFRKIEGDSVRRVQFQNVALEICVLQFQCISGTPAWTFSFFLIFIKKIIKSGLLGCHAFLIFRYCIYCVGLLVKRCCKKRFSKRFI